MRRKYIRPQSRAARWSPRFGLLALVLLLAAVGLHRFGTITAHSLLYFMAALACAVSIALLLAFCGLRALWREGAKGGMAALKGGLLALLAAAPLLFVAAGWFSLPKLYDISTDFEDPPAFLQGSRPPDSLPIKAEFTAAAAAEQTEAWPQLSGRRYDGTPDNVLQAVYAVLKAENWPISGQQGSAGEDRTILVQAVAKTFIAGFVSDIVIRLADEGDTSFVDIRAASRYLPRDYGIDARFAEDFMSRLDSEILTLPTDDSGD